MKRITLIQPQYPYGKRQIYLGGALLALASSLHATKEYIVDIFDLNITSLSTILDNIRSSDYVGITVLGSPYIPSAIELSKKLLLRGIKTPILIGGQCIEALPTEDFQRVFRSTNARQIKDEVDLLNILGINRVSMPSVYNLPFISALQRIPDGELKKYLSTELTLFISQGCGFKCSFCGAKKGRLERYRDTNSIEIDLTYICSKSKEFGISELNFYASNLDFFQKPKELLERLDLISRIKSEFGIEIKIRALACMSSFINAAKSIPDLKKRLGSSGVWCIGFGVDGTDKAVWRAQNKNQNKESDIPKCLNLCENYGIRAEVLMIMGFPQDTFKTLFKNFINSFGYVVKYKNTMLRPYLAKESIPGNEEWGQNPRYVERFLENPKLFYNLDFCMIGSKLTHPRFWHRLFSNFIYLAICGIFTPFGKCCTSPLMPLGKNRLWNRFATWWNRVVPFDR